MRLFQLGNCLKNEPLAFSEKEKIRNKTFEIDCDPLWFGKFVLRTRHWHFLRRTRLEAKSLKLSHKLVQSNPLISNIYGLIQTLGSKSLVKMIEKTTGKVQSDYPSHDTSASILNMSTAMKRLLEKFSPSHLALKATVLEIWNKLIPLLQVTGLWN